MLTKEKMVLGVLVEIGYTCIFIGILMFINIMFAR